MTPTAQQGKLSFHLDQPIRPDTDAPVNANNFIAIKPISMKSIRLA
jgi:hypothetical protein